VGWLLGLVALILAVLAIRRTRSIEGLERRAEALERDVRHLRQDLDRLRRGGAPVSARAEAAVSPVAPAALAEARAASSAPAAPEVGAAPFGHLPTQDAPPPRVPPRSPRPPAPPPPSGPRVSIDWERWIGVRGAAVLGGIVLALAGLYFFQYSIEHGLIPPWLRVVLGTAIGLGCIAGAEWRARPRYVTTANALVGGGIVVLYAAFWAAHSLYGLVGGAMAFVLMISVTGACTALAYRHSSIVIALIGLIGGFSTPLLLASGEDRPIALFSYILLLDAALLFVARKRGWPLLAVVSLVGTLLYQGLWIGLRMGPEQWLIALCVLAVFAVAFAFALRQTPSGDRGQWLWTQAGATLLPFAFASYLAVQVDPTGRWIPIGLAMALLSASAAFLARTLDRAWLGLAAACASMAVLAVWVWDGLDVAAAWQVVGVHVLLAGVFHVFVELDRERLGRQGPAPAAMVAVLAAGVLLWVAAWSSPVTGAAPWLAGWVALAALAWRHAAFGGRGWLPSAAMVAPGLALMGLRWNHPDQNVFGDPGLGLPLMLALAVLPQAVALVQRDSVVRRGYDLASALLAALLLLGTRVGPTAEDPLLALAAASVLGVLVALGATRAASGRMLLVATALTAGVHLAWTASSGEPADLAALALQLATAAAFTFWPFAVFERLSRVRLAWIASALAAPAWFPSLYALYENRFGGAAIGLLPVGLGALVLAAAWLAAQRRAYDDPLRVSNLAWYGAVTLAFVTAAIPLQLEKEWITLGWALEAFAVSLLWRRLDHPGLKALAVALSIAVTLRLVANVEVLQYHARPGWRILNWLLYTYWVPTASLLATARVLAADELPRLRAAERRFYPVEQPLGAAIAAAGAIVIFFVWINLAIADWYSADDVLRVAFERMPARDLTTSLAWALYALVLLAAGVRGGLRSVRWLSLGLMLVTAAKVFLYDLGELEDLYRVGSLLGLAVSLIGISLAYQRFVVRDPASHEA